MNDSHLSIVRKIISENLNIKRSINVLDESPKVKNLFQHLLGLKYFNKEIQSIYEIVISHALQSEKICPGSGILFLQKFSKQNKSNELKISPKVSKKDIRDIIEEISELEIVRDILNQILDLSNVNTKISIKKSNSSNLYIEFTDSFSFKINSPIKFIPSTLQDVKAICIDGFIESVSEIHHILTYFSENKSPCLLFCRGFSEDVLSTIKVNNDRKTLSIFPFIIPFDVENSNLLVDIAVASGCDVISSLKGDLISSIDLRSLGNIESSLISVDTVRIKNSKTKKRVSEHVNHLKRKIEEKSELTDLFVKRIKQLSSSNIEICIPDDMNYNSLSMDLDLGIRTITSIISNSYNPEKTASLIFSSFQENISNICLL